MASQKVFIDGHVGTTGLRIRDWLSGRSDLEILTPSDEARKDPLARREMLQAADIAVLCLPDEAAREASEWAENSPVRLLDASTAHRVADGWTYGLPELTPEQRDLIRAAKRVANPGCYPSAFLLCVRPLVDAGQLVRGRRGHRARTFFAIGRARRSAGSRPGPVYVHKR